MGLSHGKCMCGMDIKYKKNTNKLNSYDYEPEVSSYEVKILKEMWTGLTNDIEKVGVLFFIR
jgi:hypothetical protein